MEIVNWKIEARGPEPMAGRPFRFDHDYAPGDPLKGTREAWFPESGLATVPVYDRYRLPAGASVAGPAIIEEHESTMVLGHGDRAAIDAHLNLVIDIARGVRRS
jgi:N-methylhydantoinase A